MTVENSENKTSAIPPGVMEFLTPGMSASAFAEVEKVHWLPLTTETTRWKPVRVDLKKQHTYSEIESIISKLIVSDIASASVASLMSVDERKIYVLEIGKGRSALVLTAGAHAREVANTQFLMKFAAYLIGAYERRNAYIMDLLQTHRVILLPCVNPDGYSAAITGSAAIRNRSLFLAKLTDQEIFGAKSNARGVDINRNLPSYSAGAWWEVYEKPDASIEKLPSVNYFAGFTLGSEPETKVLMSFLMQYLPFAHRFVDLHSALRVIYSGKPHLSDQFNDLCLATAQLIRKTTSYRICGVEDESTGDGTDGTITDFAAEIAAGFQYDAAWGRLAPPGESGLTMKYNRLIYPFSVNTLETLKSSKKEGYGLLRTSDPAMHAREWKVRSIRKMLLDLLES